MLMCPDFIVLAIITSSLGFIWNPLARLTGSQRQTQDPVGEGQSWSERRCSLLPTDHPTPTWAGQMVHPARPVLQQENNYSQQGIQTSPFSNSCLRVAGVIDNTNISVIDFEFCLPSAHFPHLLKYRKINLFNFHWLSLPFIFWDDMLMNSEEEQACLDS